MSFDDRVDVVELILKVLKEHEKNLDAIVYQLGETLTSQPSSGQTGHATSFNQHKIVFRKWFEFKERCLRSDIVAFEAKDDSIMVTALKGGNLYYYSEDIPEVPMLVEEDVGKVLANGHKNSPQAGSPNFFSSKLQCGIGIQVRRMKVDLPNGEHIYRFVFSVDPEDTRTWLSEELKTEKKSVVFGVIE
jgi:hypothetical protein